MSDMDDDVLEVIVQMVSALLGCLEALEKVQHGVQPGRGYQLAEMTIPFQKRLLDAGTAFEQTEFPDHVLIFSKQLIHTAIYTLRACNHINKADRDNFAVMKAMRSVCRAQEMLYPLANIITPVSKYFLEDGAKSNTALIEALGKEIDKDGEDGRELGYLPGNADRKTRGGFCLYVPENLEADRAVPLVVALHGGTGHGADFLWYWLREARTRGFILLAPTSQGDTWSLMGEEHDLPFLHGALETITKKYNIDQEHILLTGMSDGGTYAMLAGIREDSPFTHLAPFSCVLHPEISMNGNIRHARERNIYLLHGTQDWMFPIEAAKMGQMELEAAGANLHFRVVEGLSHAYRRSENAAVLKWFDPSLTIPVSPDEKPDEKSGGKPDEKLNEKPGEKPDDQPAETA